MSTSKQRCSSKERFWRRIVREWRSSGLSVRAFCRERDLSEPNFYAWRRTLAERDAQAARFVAVRVVADEKAATAARRSGSGLELLLSSGRVLRIGADFDEAALRRVLTLLEEGQS
jgi:transposase-like protein